MCKDNAVGTVIAETGCDCGSMAQLSDLSMPFQLCASPLKGEVGRSCEPSARSAAADSEKRQICTTSRTALDCEKKTILCFLPLLSTPRSLFERGLGESKSFDMAARSETRKPSCQSHKQ